ncbi:MAG: LytTR family DNA-binding domain-containing protein, partial [Prevotella sp.]|nr:LytTR family DNA-binding domain-containing protein [Prevotella sp.]
MLPEGTKVIFTTAFKEYAFESYEVSALDFLLKPVRYNKFITAVEKAREWFDGRTASARQTVAPPPAATPAPAGESATIFLRVDGEYRQLALSRVLYVEGMKDYVMFYLTDQHRPLVTHLTMKSVEEMLPPSQFMRVHRSYIVALDKISRVDRNDCIFIGEQIIRVTDAYHDKFQQFLISKFPGAR